MKTEINQKNSFPKFLKSFPNFSFFLKEGELVEGKVLKKEGKRLLVDLDKYGIGLVYGLEFIVAKEIIKKLQIGEPLTAKVLVLDNEEGFVELSLKEVGKQKIWEQLRELKEKEEVLKVKISGYNSGGLLAEVNGLPAFLPVSQLSFEHYPRVEEGEKNKILNFLKKFIDQEFAVKIIDLNFKTGKLILSEKEAFTQDLQELLKKYKIGDVIEGIISGITDFGVFVKFVDQPGLEGLIHISEIGHGLIDNPKQVVKIDESVKAKIIEIKNNRIFLSLKALKINPWEKVEEKYKISQEVFGKVYKFTPFGAFIGLDEQIHGLIHVSEFGSVQEMKERLKLDQTYKFTIALIKPEDKRLILKQK